MSFAAVAALVFFYDETRGFWANQNKKGGWFRRFMIVLIGCCMTSVVATIATAPYTMFHFQQFPIYSVIGNVAAMPVIGFIIMPAAIFVYLLMPFGLDFIPLWVMGQGVSAMLWISHVISTWNYASLNLVAWPLSSLIAFTVAGLTVMVLRGRARIVAIIPVIIGVLCVFSYRPPDVLVSSSAKLAMVTTPEKTVWLSNRRSDKFSAENWLRAAGIDPSHYEVWPKEGVLESGLEQNAMRLSCDPYGCLGNFHTQEIAFSFDPRTLKDDCREGITIIANYPVKDKACREVARNVIDMWDLRNQGTHAIWLKPQGGIKSKTVAGERGTRPWTSAGSKR
jgi:competence protein ComEC